MASEQLPWSSDYYLPYPSINDHVCQQPWPSAYYPQQPTDNNRIHQQPFPSGQYLSHSPYNHGSGQQSLPSPPHPSQSYQHTRTSTPFPHPNFHWSHRPRLAGYFPNYLNYTDLGAYLAQRHSLAQTSSHGAINPLFQPYDPRITTDQWPGSPERLLITPQGGLLHRDGQVVHSYPVVGQHPASDVPGRFSLYHNPSYRSAQAMPERPPQNYETIASESNRSASIRLESEVNPSAAQRSNPQVQFQPWLMPDPKHFKPVHPIPVERTPPESKRCFLCLTDFEGFDMVTKFPYHCHKCELRACADCLKDLVVRASKEETLMPAKCCSIIPLSAISHLLDSHQIDSYRAKFEEWMTPQRTYCPEPRCSKFISPKLITKGPSITCPSCSLAICKTCKKAAHESDLCDLNDLDAQLTSALNRWGIKRCPKCSHGLRRMKGCRHMRCVCGHHFCWRCLKPGNECIGACNEDSPLTRGLNLHRSEGLQASASPTSSVQGVSVHDADVVQTTTSPTPSIREDATQAPNEYDQEVLWNPEVQPTSEEKPASPDAIRISLPDTNEASTLDVPNDDLDAELMNDQTKDFGDEPLIPEAFTEPWTCSHNFRHPQRRNLQPVTQPSPAYKVGFIVRGSLECNRCWKTVYPQPETAARSYNLNTAAEAYNTGRISRTELDTIVEEARWEERPTEEQWQSYVPKKYGDKGKAVGAFGNAWALECEDCRFVVCGECFQGGEMITVGGKHVEQTRFMDMGPMTEEE